MEIGALIKAVRKEMGVSQKEFANKLHVSFSTVNRWENGHVTPNQLAIVTLVELCERENVSARLLQELKIQKN
ncbi:helix-turn-helix domain-containing protein [Cuneatibacter sp. NSJ-177]|uniref:helix-turn-helix domain-containing protein n=1 Tax=Cuneatibacter sp. NSJ-177 TaxID=2931401 RepID=UPI001FD03373|nr:helix-turn-helix transcriptional regulator [Cuneatibacter sp. NSJ-177]MCJ7837236.1 helix-turn-helix domain-containing protein [Cuneatibacter sp. NSJ-177]